MVRAARLVFLHVSIHDEKKERKKLLRKTTAFAFATISTEMKIKNTNESECCSVFSPHSFGYEFFSLSQHTKDLLIHFFFLSFLHIHKDRRRDDELNIKKKKLCVKFTFTHILNHKFFLSFMLLSFHIFLDLFCSLVCLSLCVTSLLLLSIFSMRT